MIYLLMCGGSYPHWQEPKHLQKIHGEPIVARTIRLLHENGIENIAITSNDDRFKQFGVPVLEHNNTYIYREKKLFVWAGVVGVLFKVIIIERVVSTSGHNVFHITTCKRGNNVLPPINHTTINAHHAHA